MVFRRLEPLMGEAEGERVKDVERDEENMNPCTSNTFTGLPVLSGCRHTLNVFENWLCVAKKANEASCI